MTEVGTNGVQASLDGQEGFAMFLVGNWQGIIYRELLPYGQTLKSKMYCQQLNRLPEAIVVVTCFPNKRRIMFDLNNDKPQTAIVTRQKLRSLVGKFL